MSSKRQRAARAKSKMRPTVRAVQSLGVSAAVVGSRLRTFNEQMRGVPVTPTLDVDSVVEGAVRHLVAQGYARTEALRSRVLSEVIGRRFHGLVVR